MPDHLAPVPDEPVEKAAPDFGQLSNFGLYRRSGYVQREYLPNLRGRRASEVWREMANDPTVGSLLFAIDRILRRIEWDVEPIPSAEGGQVTDADLERADFLKTCMDDLSHSWEAFVADALTMVAFGFSYLEIVYKRRESTELTAPAHKRTRHPDGRIGWRKFCLVPQETILDWDMDEYGGIQSALQQTGWSGRIPIPIDKAMLFRTDYRSPTGTSLLRAAYPAWYTKKNLERIEAIGIERDVAGLPVFMVDGDYYQRHEATLKDIIRNIRMDEQMGVTLPVTYDDRGNPSVKLELLASPGQKAYDVDKVIARYKRDIFNTLLMGMILLGQEKVGTQALASEQRDLSDTTLQSLLNEIASVINDHAVPRLFQLNGEDLAFLPRIVPGELRPTDVNEFATALKDIAAAGFMVSGDPEVEAEVRRRLGLPQMADEVQEQMMEDLLNPPEPPPVVAPPAPGEDDADAAGPPVRKRVDKDFIQGPDGKFQGSTGGGSGGGGAGEGLSESQHSALAPQKRFNAQLKGDTEAALRTTKEGATLADALDDFQHGEGAKGLRAGITKETNVPGSGGPKAQAVMGAVRNSPPSDQVLYRGMRVPTSHKGLVEQYKEGGTIDMNLSSFSSSAGVAETFSEGAGRGGTKVIIGVVGQHRSLPIQNLAKNSSVFSEKEFLSGGRFRVLGIDKQGDASVITLQQTQTL